MLGNTCDASDLRFDVAARARAPRVRSRPASAGVEGAAWWPRSLYLSPPLPHSPNFVIGQALVCSAPMEAANDAVLGVFEREVLHPDVTDTVVRKALDKFRAAQQDKKEDRQRYHRLIAAVDAGSGRFVTAIAAGGDIPSLVEAAQQCHARKTILLETADLGRNQDIDHDYDELERELRAHFRQSWQTIMTRQVTPARQILGKLFNGKRILH